MHHIWNFVLARLLSPVLSYKNLGALTLERDKVYTQFELGFCECVEYTYRYITITLRMTHATLNCFPRPSLAIQLHNEHPSILRVE